MDHKSWLDKYSPTEYYDSAYDEDMQVDWGVEDFDFAPDPMYKIDAFDEVTKPSHYNHSGIECIDSIKASMSKLEYEGYLKGSVEKYLWRYRYKGKEVQDLEKGRWYLDKLIESVKA